MNNKIVKLWFKNIDGNEINLKPRFWLIIYNENGCAIMLNLTSKKKQKWQFQNREIKTNCKMLFSNKLDEKKDTIVKLSNILELNGDTKSNLKDIVFSNCDCDDGCLDQNDFEQIKNLGMEQYNIYLNSVQKNIDFFKKNVSDVVVLKDWSYHKVINWKTGKAFISIDDFLKSNLL